jgi:hypothetical protein
MIAESLSGLDVKTMSESLMEAFVFLAVNQWKNETLNRSSIKVHFFAYKSY